MGLTQDRTAPQILLDLVSIPSVSSVSNRPVIEYAQTYLNPALWRINLHPYYDNAGIEKVNLVATAGPSHQMPELTLVCHTDTVPFDPAWTEAVHPVQRGGNVYGRGSCDVKGFLACVLDALGRIDLRSLARPLSIVLTADEEIGCVGAKHLAGLRAVESRYMIVGEPTGLRPATTGKGYGLAQIIVHGREAHSAFPEQGRSAIRDAARVIERLDIVAERLALKRTPTSSRPTPLSTSA